MTDIDNVFDEFESTDDDVYYDPDQSSIVPEGTYPAKIVNLKKFNTVTQKGNEATIYKPVYRIDDGVLVASGTLVDDKGVFRYKPPKNKKGIRISGSGNVDYKRYLDKLDIPLIKEEIEGKTLYKLPSITVEMVKNVDVVINVKHASWESKKYRKARTVAEARLAYKKKVV